MAVTLVDESGPTTTKEEILWTTLLKDNVAFIEKCDKFQKHANMNHARVELLHSVTTPWPFYLWGMGILGSFLLAFGQLKFMILRV